MFGSCVTSSSRLIVFAALTESESPSFTKSTTRSVTDFLIVFGVELVDTIRRNTSIDWTVRENVQAKMRLAVKKILRKHGYPPDMELKATETVLEQAKLLANDFSSSSTYNLNGDALGMVAEP